MGNDKKSLAHEVVEEITQISYVNTILHKISVFDRYTEWHSMSVAVEATTIGIALGLTKEKIRNLAIAAILHDAGKTMIDPDILNKPARLTEEEFSKVRKHPEFGVAVIEQTIGAPINDEIKYGILHHHEDWDGGGYNGLAGEQIHFFGRIIRVADSFDAMMDCRPYHLARREGEVISMIFIGRGKYYDPAVIDAFMRLENSERTNAWRIPPSLGKVLS